MTGAPPRVRLFSPADAEAVAAMVGALNAEEGYNRGTAPDAAALRAAFLGPGAAGRLLVAVDGTPVGYATLHTTYETEFAARGAYLGDLFVEPRARRRGLGRALVAAAAHTFYRALGAEDEPIRAFALTLGTFDGLAAAAAAGVAP